MQLIIGLLILICIYIILASSLNLLVGYTGILSMAHAAVFGVGAYTTAILQTNFNLGFFPSLIGAVLVASLLSVIMAYPSLEVSGDYFIVASFGMQLLLYTFFKNFDGLTGGPAGIFGIPRPNVLGFQLNSDLSYLILSIIITVIVVGFLVFISKTEFGRVLRAIKEDEIAVESMGKNVRMVKVKVTVISGAVAAIAGALYADYVTYINPESFTVHESIFIVSLIILGGLGSWKGATIGAAIIFALPEALKFLPISDVYAAPLRQVVYGFLIILFMLLRPQGLFGTTKAFQHEANLDQADAR